MPTEETTGGKPTPGEWRYTSQVLPNGHTYTEVIHEGNAVIVTVLENRAPFGGMPEITGPVAIANARLIADAGTVYNRTGLTPSELAEQNEAMREALALAVRTMALARIEEWPEFDVIRQALAKCQPNNPKQ